jgi:hypothetical protein
MNRRAHIVALLLTLSPIVHAEDANDLRTQAIRDLKRAAMYFHDRVASHGGYVYFVSLDLKSRWGEGAASADTIFVQPPGTPAVGMAFLSAFDATGDAFYLACAKDAGYALCDGQLESGGWTQVIHFGDAPAGGKLGKYRTRKGGNWNASSLDDDQTTAALSLLIRLDKALAFKDERIHSTCTYALDRLLKAQFPSGGFPQVWTGPVDAKQAKPASYPDYDWKTVGRVKNYWDYPTLNDNVAGNVARTLSAAHRTYGDDRFKTALRKLGDFLVLAQMPDPQPAWCQQYNHNLIPIWARKFEPPAIATSESQDVIAALIAISRETGDKKYLEPIPRAIAFLQRVVQPDGKMPRYLELQTNKPLFMNEKYELTYDPANAPSHYGWFQPSKLKKLDASYQRALKGEADPAHAPPGAEEVRAILQALDDQGRWVSTYDGERLVGQPKFEKGFQFLSSDVFNRNVETLSAFLAAEK